PAGRDRRRPVLLLLRLPPRVPRPRPRRGTGTRAGGGLAARSGDRVARARLRGAGAAGSDAGDVAAAGRTQRAGVQRGRSRLPVPRADDAFPARTLQAAALAARDPAVVGAADGGAAPWRRVRRQSVAARDRLVDGAVDGAHALHRRVV